MQFVEKLKNSFNEAKAKHGQTVWHYISTHVLQVALNTTTTVFAVLVLARSNSVKNLEKIAWLFFSLSLLPAVTLVTHWATGIGRSRQRVSSTGHEDVDHAVRKTHVHVAMEHVSTLFATNGKLFMGSIVGLIAYAVAKKFLPDSVIHDIWSDPHVAEQQQIGLTTFMTYRTDWIHIHVLILYIASAVQILSNGFDFIHVITRHRLASEKGTHEFVLWRILGLLTGNQYVDTGNSAGDLHEPTVKPKGKKSKKKRGNGDPDGMNGYNVSSHGDPSNVFFLQ